MPDPVVEPVAVPPTILNPVAPIEGAPVVPPVEPVADPPGDVKPVGDAPKEWSETDIKSNDSLNVLETGVFKELVGELKTGKVTVEHAQLATDLAGKAVQKVVDAHSAKWATTMTEWSDATRADKDIGGPNLEATLTDARSALNTFGSSDLGKLVDSTGLGNHVEFIRFLSKIGVAIKGKNDNFIFGKENQNEVPKTHAQILYPDQN